MEYVNIGRVVESLSHRGQTPGRRDVYIAQVKQHGIQDEIVKIIRMQKWGIREHLDDGKRLLDAIIQSEEYTEYILDRRLGCRQLGMNLPAADHGQADQRAILGAAPRSARRHDLVAVFRARLHPRHGHRQDSAATAGRRRPSPRGWPGCLGQAAAPNMIVGRCDLQGRVVFDDGDEVLIENEAGLPVDIVVADQMGTFADYRTDLEHFAAEYAEPVNRRLPLVADPEEFAGLYVEAFVARFSKIQLEYRKRQAGVRHAVQASSPRRGRQLRLSLGMRAGSSAASRAADLGNLIRSHIAIGRR